MMIFSSLKNLRFALVWASVIVNLFTALETADTDIIKLERQWIYKNSITISGYSSGGWFVHYFHIIHSKLFRGVGIFAGLYYTGTLENSPTIREAKNTLKKNEKAGLIDPLKNLKNQKIFIWAGTDDDPTVRKRVGNVVDIYAPYMASPSNLFTKIQYSPHSPTPTGACSSEQEPPGTYHGACHYDGYFTCLKFLLGKLKKPNGQIKVQNLMKFDQTEFFADLDGESSLADYGFLYIPSKCSGRRNRCLLHIYFHGCSLRKSIDEMYYTKGTNYLEISEVNNIIFLFPRMKRTDFNKDRCWDNAGFTGPNYVTNKGLQVQAVRKMIQRVAGV